MAAGRLLAAALIGCALLAPASGAVTVRVLFKSGDAAADGTRLDSLDNPIATGASTVVFRGGTSAVLLRQGGEFVVVARTGDPLPAPLVGTFNELGDPAINDHGVVAFRAALNAAEDREQLFLYEAAGLSRIASASGGRTVADINDNADVLIKRRTRGLEMWTHATGQVTERVARRDLSLEVHRYLRFGERPVLSDAGVVAYHADFRVVRTRGPRRRRTGIFTASDASTVAIAWQGDPSPIPNGTYGSFPVRSGGEALAINVTGDVAFTATITFGGTQTRSVFLHRADGTGTATIAQVGDMVDGVELTDISRAYVGVDTARRVAFVGCFADASCRLVRAENGSLAVLSAPIAFTEFAARLTDSGQTAWSVGDDLFRFDGVVTPVLSASDATPLGTQVVAGRPSINEAGTVAFRAARNALYHLANGRAQPLVSGGDPIAGGTTVRRIGTHAYRGGVLAFVARESEGRTLIALDRGTGLTKLVASGDPAPGGGSFALADGPLALQRDNVVFLSSLVGGSSDAGFFRASFDGHVEALLTTGARAPGGGLFQSFDGILDAQGGTVVFSATLDDLDSGLFTLRGARTREVATLGDRLPGRRKRSIGGFGAVAVSGSRVLFAASADEATMIVLKRGNTARRLARNGARAPGGGRFGQIFDAVGLGPNMAAFVAEVNNRPWPEGLFVGSGDRLRLLVTTGAEADGGSLALAGAGGVTLVDHAVVLRAALTGGTANQGLVSISVRE